MKDFMGILYVSQVPIHGVIEMRLSFFSSLYIETIRIKWKMKEILFIHKVQREEETKQKP